MERETRKTVAGTVEACVGAALKKHSDTMKKNNEAAGSKEVQVLKRKVGDMEEALKQQNEPPAKVQATEAKNTQPNGCVF